jgi:large subunit ribosomal protein L32
MAVPKRRSSKCRIRRRHHSSNHQVTVTASKPCPNCGAPQQPHRVCPACGHYRGRQVVTVEVE